MLKFCFTAKTGTSMSSPNRWLSTPSDFNKNGHFKVWSVSINEGVSEKVRKKINNDIAKLNKTLYLRSDGQSCN